MDALQKSWHDYHLKQAVLQHLRTELKDKDLGISVYGNSIDIYADSILKTSVTLKTGSTSFIISRGSQTINMEDPDSLLNLTNAIRDQLTLLGI